MMDSFSARLGLDIGTRGNLIVLKKNSELALKYFRLACNLNHPQAVSDSQASDRQKAFEARSMALDKV